MVEESEEEDSAEGVKGEVAMEKVVVATEMAEEVKD